MPAGFAACLRSYIPRRAAIAAAAISFGLLLLPWETAVAQVQSYWLRQGGGIVGSCPGKPQGEPLQVANKNAGWVLITGVVTCRDEGANYSFELNFLRVEINPGMRSAIERDRLDFDWIGLAVFKPQGNGAQIDWLYDEALPIEGSLAKTSQDKIYFGNLKFSVPKNAIGQATNFLFYMTSHGPLYQFELL
jgi:hypothetical protein